jgi:hypothetical protein
METALLFQRVDDLQRERARLEEEVLQLKAAVRIWSEVYRQTTGGSKTAPPVGMETQ